MSLASLVKRSPLAATASALRHTRGGDYLFAGANLIGLARAHAGGRQIGVDVEGAMGMGATLTHLTRALGLCERHDLTAHIRLSNVLYARPGQADWFPEFFERTDEVGAASPTVPWIKLRKDIDHALLRSPPLMTLAQEKALFDRHVRLKRFLHDEAEAVFAPLADATRLGVHYRGADKHDEAPPVQRAAAIETVRRELSRGGHRGIVLATDEPAFAAALRAAVPDVPVILYDRPEVQAQAGQPIHFSAADGYWKGVDALVNILLLARCGTVVRTASFLSGWAKVFSPEQRIVMLNHAHSESRFPDNLIGSDDTP